jgi:hypothetical protein
MRKVSTHCQTHKGANGVAVVTFARVEYSAAADPDWVAPGRCRPANQRAARLGRAGIFAEVRNLGIRSQTMKPTTPHNNMTRMKKSEDTPVDAPCSHSPACPHRDWFQPTSGTPELTTIERLRVCKL